MEQAALWRRFTLADCSPVPGAGLAKLPRVGQRPTWAEWREGCFYTRPAVFGPLWQAFQTWSRDETENGTQEDEKLKVFLIEGQAGDGKSTLLLQLMGEVLREELTQEVDWMATPSDGRAYRAAPPEDLDVVFVDSLPSVAEGAAGHRWVSRLCAAGAVALVTTGAPGARRELKSRFGGLLEITVYPLPSFTLAEADELAAWWGGRGGRRTAVSALWREGVGLTEFLFTLQHGKPLAALVPELRLALGNLGLGGRVKFIWLANALGWRAPVGLLATEAARAHGRGLAERNVVPLDIDTDGLRLGPPALAWPMALEWTGQTRDWRFSWVEALQFTLKAWVESGAVETTNRFLRHLIKAEGLINGSGPREAYAYGTVSRRDLVRELYRAHRRDFDGDPAPATVEAWLVLNEELALMLLPDPVECATEVFTRPGRGRERARTPGLAAAAWLAADSRQAPLGPAARKALSSYFLSAPHAEGMGRALAKIVRTSRKSTAEARQLAGAWLFKRAANPEAQTVREAMALRNEAGNSDPEEAI